MSRKLTILFVDDERSILKLHSRMVERDHYVIRTADSAEAALAVLAAEPVHVLVSDECMPGIRGCELLERVRIEYPRIATILLTGYASLDSAMRAVNEGNVFRFLTKPCDRSTLRRAIRQAADYQLLLASAERILRSSRRRAHELKVLERGNPGIASVERNASGMIELGAPSDADLKELEAVLSRVSPQSASPTGV